MKEQDMVIHGAGFVLCRDSKSGPEFLVLKARWGRHWSIPKGHIASGESDFLSTAFRETDEETGIEQDQIKHVKGFEEVVTTTLKRPTRNCPEGVKNTKVFMGVIEDDVEIILSDEHTEHWWVKLVVALRLLGQPYHEVVGKANLLMRSNEYKERIKTL